MAIQSIKLINKNKEYIKLPDISFDSVSINELNGISNLGRINISKDFINFENEENDDDKNLMNKKGFPLEYLIKDLGTINKITVYYSDKTQHTFLISKNVLQTVTAVDNAITITWKKKE